ncbi:TPA: hypothetical protein QDB45_001651 [Burkholderia vietnamiensis]|nr:hypothetical protein [Burkholderia vietnamiensis]
MLHLILSFSFLLSHLTLGLAGLTAMSGLMLPAGGLFVTHAAIHGNAHDVIELIADSLVISGNLGALVCIVWTKIELHTGGRR